MLDIFKNFDLVDELEKHISPDEDIFVECRPNKLPFILRRIWQPLVVVALFIALLVLYVIVRPFASLIFQNFFDLVFIFLALAVIAFAGWQLYKSILDAKTNYYVVATDGIHILSYDKTLQYTCILFKDIKSVILKTGAFGTGDIYIKEISEKVPEGFIQKFMYTKSGLIGIDEVEKVYDVIRQLALQENENIFFADANDANVDTSYFKDVKKYDKEIRQKKDDSLMSRRKN